MYAISPLLKVGAMVVCRFPVTSPVGLIPCPMRANDARANTAVASSIHIEPFLCINLGKSSGYKCSWAILYVLPYFDGKLGGEKEHLKRQKSFILP